METKQEKLARLKDELEELTKALPPHGLKPAHLLRVEELEDEVERLEKEISKE